MAAENKKLSEKVAAGEGAKHNIEVEEADERRDGDADDVEASDDEAKKDSKAPVIEMVRWQCVSRNMQNSTACTTNRCAMRPLTLSALCCCCCCACTRTLHSV